MSVLVLAYAAAFNVGYFGAFGLHFIGVIDVSNFVYSFAFLLIFFVGFVIVVLLGTNYLWKRDDVWKSSKVVAIGLAILAVMLAAFFWILEGFSTAIVLAVTSYLAAVSSGLALIFGYWATTKRLKMQWLAVLVACSIPGLSFVGRAFGEQQKKSDKHYTFATKSGNITGAAMLRASSNGFLISVDGNVQYLSASEVKSVVGEQTSRP